MKLFRFSTALSTAILLALTLPFFPARAESEPPKVVAPSPDLAPQEVVAGMLAALKKNSDQGLEELYAFSSPGNVEQIGSLNNFKHIIRQGFADMLGLEAARMAPPLVDGSRAMVTVEIIGSDRQLHQYVFILSIQEFGPCTGCWMADAVVHGESFKHPPIGPDALPHGYPRIPEPEDQPEPGQPYEIPA